MADAATIQDLCETVVDCPHSTPAWIDSGVLVLRSQNIRNGRLDLSAKSFTDEAHYRDRSRRAELRAGDLVITREAPMGEVCMIPDDLRCCLGQRMVMLRPNAQRCDARYLLYALQSPRVQEQISWSEGTGSTVSNLRIPHLKALRIPTPPMAEQQVIGAVLGALDDKIEQNRRTAQALERLARAIFRAWFVDLEPVKARAAGAASFPGMPQPVFDALPTRFVDSDIGPVPEGWEVGAVKDLATLSKAQAKPQGSLEEVFDHFSIPAFDSGMRPVVESGSMIKSNKFLVVEGCVLLSKLNPRIARVWLPPRPRGRQQIASTEFLVHVPRHASDRHYLFCQFQQTAFRDELAQGASGTSNSHQRVRPEDVLHWPIIVPPASTRKGFAETADPLFALAAANLEQSAKLAEMRVYLLPKLLSGQVRVREAGRAAKAAV